MDETGDASAVDPSLGGDSPVQGSGAPSDPSADPFAIGQSDTTVSGLTGSSSANVELGQQLGGDAIDLLSTAGPEGGLIASLGQVAGAINSILDTANASDGWEATAAAAKGIVGAAIPEVGLIVDGLETGLTLAGVPKPEIDATEGVGAQAAINQVGGLVGVLQQGVPGFGGLVTALVAVTTAVVVGVTAFFASGSTLSPSVTVQPPVQSASESSSGPSVAAPAPNIVNNSDTAASASTQDTGQPSSEPSGEPTVAAPVSVVTPDIGPPTLVASGGPSVLPIVMTPTVGAQVVASQSSQPSGPECSALVATDGLAHQTFILAYEAAFTASGGSTSDAAWAKEYAADDVAEQAWNSWMLADKASVDAGCSHPVTAMPSNTWLISCADFPNTAKNNTAELWRNYCSTWFSRYKVAIRYYAGSAAVFGPLNPKWQAELLALTQ